MGGSACGHVYRNARRAFRSDTSATYARRRVDDDADQAPRSGSLPRALVALSSLLTRRPSPPDLRHPRVPQENHGLDTLDRREYTLDHRRRTLDQRGPAWAAL